jgi:tripartite-type tricarboxylate transporter receptor subunit TctC
MKQWIAAMSLCLTAAMTPAQACPQGSILRFVVPFPPGGSYDILARNIAQGLTQQTGQKVVVENRSGGNGEVGTTLVAKAAPDGCTLVFWGDGLLINQGMVENRAVDILKDFTAVTLVARTAQTLVARADFRAKTLPALIEASKQPGADIRYATAGIGTPGHLVMELLNSKSGSKFRHVPYRGGALALTDLLGGQIDLMFISLVTGSEQVRAGKLRAYGVTSDKRQTMFPDLPAIGEVVPGFESTAWFGVFAPAHLPEEITEKLHATIVAALSEPRLREQLKTEGATAVGNTPKEFTAFVREDIERWAPVVKASGAKPN